MELIERIKSIYTLSNRKYVTFQKLFEDQSLDYEDVDKLKTAQAVYETVPVIMLTPYAYFLLRKIAQANKSNQIRNFTLGVLLTYPLADYGVM